MREGVREGGKEGVREGERGGGEGENHDHPVKFFGKIQYKKFNKTWVGGQIFKT